MTLDSNCSEFPNNSDTISRQAAIDAIRKLYIAEPKINNDYVYDMAIDQADDALRTLPSAEPERKKGEWNFIGDNMFVCTSCGVAYTTQQLNGLRNYDTDPYAPKFCPNCGAELRGEQE